MHRASLQFPTLVLESCASTREDRPRELGYAAFAVLTALVGVLAGCPGADGVAEDASIPESEFASELAKAWCAASEDCSCQPNLECEPTFTDWLNDEKDDATGIGLTYDAECVAEFVDWLRTCEPGRHPPARVRVCGMFHGQGKEGDPCTEVELGSSCSRGLDCSGDSNENRYFCVDPDRTVGLGEECGSSPCEEHLGCRWDYETELLRCASLEPGACASDSDRGPDGCGADEYCGRNFDMPADVCLPLLQEGEGPCEYDKQCAEGLYCAWTEEIGSCRTALALGDACMPSDADECGRHGNCVGSTCWAHGLAACGE